MAHFAYRAQCPNGSAISGVLVADDFDAARDQLATMKLAAVELTETEHVAPSRSLGTDDFIFFNEQLASLASAGICLDEGLQQMARDIGSPRLRAVIEAIASEIHNGVPLEQAVAKNEARLPAFYGRVVRAGVQSGQLPATLLNLSQHLRLLSQTKRIVVESLAYPMSVCLFAVAIVSLMLVFVVPMFEEMFVDFDTTLPGITMLLIDFANAFPALVTGCGIILACALIAWFAARASPTGHRLRERAAMALPLIGPVVRASLISRFARGLALTVSSGVPLPDSLRLAAGATGSPTLDDDAEALALGIERGLAPTDAGKRARLVPGMFGYVVEIAIGRNGLPEAMFQLARAYDLRAAHSQAMLRGYLVPLAIVFVGGLVGCCIAALFLPLISLINSISGG